MSAARRVWWGGCRQSAAALPRLGSALGGDFQHIPACRTASSLHCVIAFSTFDAPPPANTMFGVGGTSAESVLCTNPARLSGSGNELSPIYPSTPFAPGTLLSAGIALLHLTLPTASTPWISAPNSYTARCTTGSGPHVLLVSPRLGAPLPSPSPDASWGLHLLDANIALGNLLDVVRAETHAYEARSAAGRRRV